MSGFVFQEGMGRAIETNVTASFTVDTLCLGMIKHPGEQPSMHRGMLTCCSMIVLLSQVGRLWSL